MVGAGRFELPTPCAQDIGCPHLGINRFNNLRTLLCNSACKTADDTNWKSCRKCRLRNQSTWARTCCFGRGFGPSAHSGDVNKNDPHDSVHVLHVFKELRLLPPSALWFRLVPKLKPTRLDSSPPKRTISWLIASLSPRADRRNKDSRYNDQI